MDVNVCIFFPCLDTKTDKYSGYCGNTINPGGGPAPTTDCSFLCPGNSLEYCGAGSRLDSIPPGSVENPI
jgi:hypothetical protein